MPDRSELIPYLFYRDVGTAIAFLSRAFGFVETFRTTGDAGGEHAEMELDGLRIMLGGGASGWRMASPAGGLVATCGVFLYVDEVDARFGRARDAGAEVVQAPTDLSYGRSFTVRDLDGHPWFFTRRP